MGKRDQSDNSVWFSFRKGIIIASKFHDVMTKMKKVVGGGGVVNLWSSFQKVLGSTYKNSNIPVLKYGREMEGHPAENFKEVLAGKEHKSLSLKECGLFLDKTYPFIGVNPDRIVKCDCYKDSCLEMPIFNLS